MVREKRHRRSAATALVTVLALAAAAQTATTAWAQVDFGVAPPETVQTTRAVDVLAAPQEDAEVLMRLEAGVGPLEASVFFGEGAPDYARIALDEFDGWIARDALAAMPVPLIRETALPVGLQCLGTEPFWSLSLEADGAEYDSPMLQGSRRFALDAAIPAEARGGHPAALLLRSDALDEATAIVRATDCSDGMSDRTYPWSAAVLMRGPGEPVLYEGCCRLEPPF